MLTTSKSHHTLTHFRLFGTIITVLYCRYHRPGLRPAAFAAQLNIALLRFSRRQVSTATVAPFNFWYLLYTAVRAQRHVVNEKSRASVVFRFSCEVNMQNHCILGSSLIMFVIHRPSGTQMPSAVLRDRNHALALHGQAPLLHAIQAHPVRRKVCYPDNISIHRYSIVRS